MLQSASTTLEDDLVERLLQVPSSIQELHAYVRQKGREVGERAVYKAVHQLIEARVVLKAGKRVRIDEEWLRKLRGALSSRSIPLIEKGERVSYAFNSFSHLDSFWKTIALQLEPLEEDGRIFFYNPHNFWAYLPERTESEDAYYKHFEGSKLHAFFTVGGATALDRQFKRSYQNEYFQIDERAVSFIPRNVHMSIFGDVIVTVRIAKRLAERIDVLYGSGLPIKDILPEVLAALDSFPKSRLSIENNPEKASKLRKALSRNFYFKRES